MINCSKHNTYTYILISALVFCFSTLQAQNAATDLGLLTQNEPEGLHRHTHHVEFGIANKKNALIKYNPITLSLSTLMFTYQKWVSPQISSNCYFEPTCSRYGVLLYKEFGLIKGTLATADRLMRCDRISATTFHPITFSPIDGKIHEHTNRYSLHDD